MVASIFWYDLETTGVSPALDRPVQVAGIRTTEALEEVGEPLNLYCRLSDDILPAPEACLVTGIGPEQLQHSGLSEADFMARLHQALAVPETCVAGYNNLRFDDEVTRYSLYRNFYDPYAREWQSGNSRWDLIDLLRTAFALRPEGLNWPEVEGRVSLRLELLTRANGLEHLQAHDALSDVRATIALARRVRECQPRLYQYLYALRRKDRVLEQIQLLRPLVHVSGRFSVERHYLAMVLPLAWHPVNRNALIVYDLAADPSPLWSLEADQLRERLYTRREALAEGELPVALKLVHINRCPVIAPPGVLRPEDQVRLGLDVEACRSRVSLIGQYREVWLPRLEQLYQADAAGHAVDPELRLYDGFMGDPDRRLCDQVRQASSQALAGRHWPFRDNRLEELLFRYRARNFPESLSAAEQQRWRQFCACRLHDGLEGRGNTLEAFRSRAGVLLADTRLGMEDRLVLGQWLEYVQHLEQNYPALP